MADIGQFVFILLSLWDHLLVRPDFQEKYQAINGNRDLMLSY